MCSSSHGASSASLAPRRLCTLGRSSCHACSAAYSERGRRRMASRLARTNAQTLVWYALGISMPKRSHALRIF